MTMQMRHKRKPASAFTLVVTLLLLANALIWASLFVQYMAVIPGGFDA